MLRCIAPLNTTTPRRSIKFGTPIFWPDLHTPTSTLRCQSRSDHACHHRHRRLRRWIEVPAQCTAGSQAYARAGSSRHRRASTTAALALAASAARRTRPRFSRAISRSIPFLISCAQPSEQRRVCTRVRRGSTVGCTASGIGTHRNVLLLNPVRVPDCACGTKAHDCQQRFGSSRHARNTVVSSLCVAEIERSKKFFGATVKVFPCPSVSAYLHSCADGCGWRSPY